jgi:hypothetical protein
MHNPTSSFPPTAGHFAIGLVSLVSLGISLYQFVAVSITWYHLVSLGITWYHLVSLGIRVGIKEKTKYSGLHNKKGYRSPGTQNTHVDHYLFCLLVWRGAPLPTFDQTTSSSVSLTCYENRVLWYLLTVLTYQSHVTSL